jgi:hypothetical protein
MGPQPFEIINLSKLFSVVLNQNLYLTTKDALVFHQLINLAFQMGFFLATKNL